MLDLIATGIVRDSHGARGYVKVVSHSGEYEHFRSLKQVTLARGRERYVKSIDDVRIVHNAALVKFAGVDTIDEARDMKRCEVLVARSEAAPLSSNEYYIDDLRGCRVVLDREAVGTVRGATETGGSTLLNIELLDNTTRYIPFRNEFFDEIDIDGQTLTLIAPWILE